MLVRKFKKPISKGKVCVFIETGKKCFSHQYHIYKLSLLFSLFRLKDLF